jgi:hypothetical protein
MKVTNLNGWDKNGNPKESFYMDGYLKENLDGIPRFLKAGYDCVGIISGMGKVRIGKSTMAMQVAAYISWLLAGGKMKTKQIEQDRKLKWIVEEIKNPEKPARFNLKENVVFSADQLMDTAFKLYKSYGPNQIIVYDEGRQGLDSARAMESINKGMEDFFQECGFMGHVILIVLPNFFKLHEDYAIARSLFMINTYANQRFERGFFDFYNEYQKEKLFYFGKKRIGVRAKYAASSPNFSGRFTGWSPFDKDEYNDLKKKALAKKRKTKQQLKFKKQRDSAIYLLKSGTDWSNQKISEQLSVVSGIKVSPRTIDYAIESISGVKAEQN